MSVLYNKQKAAEPTELFSLPHTMQMDDILYALASDQDAFSSVFFGTVGNGTDFHCFVLEHSDKTQTM